MTQFLSRSSGGPSGFRRASRAHALDRIAVDLKRIAPRYRVQRPFPGDTNGTNGRESLGPFSLVTSKQSGRAYALVAVRPSCASSHRSFRDGCRFLARGPQCGRIKSVSSMRAASRGMLSRLGNVEAQRQSTRAVIRGAAPLSSGRSTLPPLTPTVMKLSLTAGESTSHLPALLRWDVIFLPTRAIRLHRGYAVTTRREGLCCLTTRFQDKHLRMFCGKDVPTIP